jgi:hypothetical protein
LRVLILSRGVIIVLIKVDNKGVLVQVSMRESPERKIT